MSHADQPYLARPLAGVDQALGEGHARGPGELLGQLRERLDRLDPNHPSARPISTDRHEVRGQDAIPDQDAAADVVADETATPQERGQASRPDRPSLRKDGTETAGDDQAGDAGAGEPPAVRQPGQPAAGAIHFAASGLADGGQYGVTETVRAASDESYRPWFADDPDTPWFAEPWFVE